MSLIYSHQQQTMLATNTINFLPELDQLNFSDTSLEFDLSSFLLEQQQQCSGELNEQYFEQDHFSYHQGTTPCQNKGIVAHNEQQYNELIFLNDNESRGGAESQTTEYMETNVAATADADQLDIDLIDFSLFESSMLIMDLSGLLGADCSVVSPLSSVLESNMSEADSMSGVNSPPSPMSSFFSPDEEDDCSNAAMSSSNMEESSSSAISRVGAGGRRSGGSGMVNKKESNRAAAIRYRNKKLKERDELFAECERYAKKNADMRKRIDDTLTEISFIKSLLVEALVTINK
jgi:hypothetical protein